MALASGCAARHYSLLREANRDLLLPPGVGKAAHPSGPEADCRRDNAPVTPRASHYAVYGCYVQAGFVDWQPGMKLKVVRPALPAGETLKTEVLAQQGLHLTVQTNATGVDTRMIEPRDLGFASGVTHYRLFFLARDLDRGRKITLIGARSVAELDAATEALEAHCARPGAPCLAVAQGTVIGAQVAVIVQGKQELVPLGAAVREALPRGAVPEGLQLTRLWRGKPVAVKRIGEGAPQLLGLPLNGGDSISW
jgi:hypothetical protein